MTARPVPSAGVVRRSGVAERFLRLRGRIRAQAASVLGDGLSGHKNLLLLIQLRWIAVLGQVATMAVVQGGFGIPLPLVRMIGVLAGLIVLNLASLARLWRRTPVTNGELFTALTFDMMALTLQLYLTGGATNPFVFLYLVQVTLGAMLLEAWSTCGLLALASLCFAGLVLVHQPLALDDASLDRLFSLHIEGMVICFVLDAALLVVFVTRITRNLRAQDAHLAAMGQRAAEEDHVVRLGLLASGAAHELGTPLATLSVILGDWRRMPALVADPELAQEIHAMETEVQRCKAIVTGILLSAGEARSESAGVTTLNAFLDDLVEEWRTARGASTLTYDNALAEDRPVVSDTALKQVIFNVLDNALEVSPRWVGFAVSRQGENLVLTVDDAGPGFAEDMLRQFGKPYQSSKGRPGGGLGLFLVVNVLRKLGGRVSARNHQGGGAIVTMTLPLSALAIEEGDPKRDVG